MKVKCFEEKLFDWLVGWLAGWLVKKKEIFSFGCIKRSVLLGDSLRLQKGNKVAVKIIR